MNIFYLHTNQHMNAQYHVDQHVVKMPIEVAQMLSTNLRERFNVVAPFEGPNRIYKSVYVTHPCTEWVGETYDNFVWTWHYGVSLCAEYTHRYGKVHATRQVLSNILDLQPSGDSWPYSGLTYRPKCVRAEFKGYDTVTAYRLQYITTKQRLHKWTNRNTPDFVQDQSWTKEVQNVSD